MPACRLPQFFFRFMLVVVFGLLLPLRSYCQSGLSQNSGINASDTWVAFDLSLQTQAAVTGSVAFYNPQTKTTGTNYTLASTPRTYHMELGYDANGLIVMNVFPTGATANPISSDASSIGMIRFASGNITVFDQNGQPIPLILPSSTIAAFNPLSLLGSNPAPSLLTSLVVPNIQAQAQTAKAALSFSADDSQAFLTGSVQTTTTSNSTWTYVKTGTTWTAQQAVFQMSLPSKAVTRTLQFSNVSSFDNATNDAARIAKGDTTVPKPPTTTTPAVLTGTTTSSCPPATASLGGTQNIVFVHGFFSSGCTWHRMVPWLNQDFRFGTELVPSLSSLSALASQGVALEGDINAGGGSGYVLLGHSQGGLISRYAAQQYQAANPSQATVKGVLTLDTPHMGAPLAALPEGFVSAVIEGDATLLFDAFGCGSPEDDFICFVAALYFSSAGDVAQIGALTDLVPGSPFLNALNSQTENFKRAAVIGNTPRRWIEMRVADELIPPFNGCNPEDSCGERAIALDTEIFYDIVTTAFIISEIDCLFFCDYDACSLADDFLELLLVMDVVDLDYNFISAPDFTNGEDGFVPSPSQNYPSPLATQFSISGADSHSGAVKSDLSRNALEQALSQVFQVPTQGSCAFSVAPTVFATSSSAATSSFTVNTGAGCQWSAVSQNPWVSITGGSSGTSSGTVSFSVLANPVTVPRVTTIVVGNSSARTSFLVQQSALCTYALSVADVALPSGGGSDTVNVTTEAGCPWMAVPNASWLTITAGAGGTGSGSFTLTASPNAGDTDLLGTITVMTQTLSVILGNPVGTPGIGSVTITGSSRSVVINPCLKETITQSEPEPEPLPSPPNCPITIPETGTVSVTVGGQSFTASYATSTAAQIATSLANAMNYADSPVSAVVTGTSGTTITITSSVKGSRTNYTLSTSYTYNTIYFSSPAFVASASGAMLTGGTD
jgi:pimeloyl-ACP methyl ester carboxylesterase